MNTQLDVGNRRINRVRDARDIFDSLRREYEKIALVRSKIAGLVDGNRPFNTYDLERAGLGWFPNINTREAEDIIKKQVAGFWELEMEVPSLITLTVKDSDMLIKNLPFRDWVGIIEEEYTRLVKSWFGYELNRLMCIREKLLFGLSAHYWDDDYDWRFKTLKCANIFFPSDAESDISRLDLFCVWHSYRLYEIMDIIENEEAAEGAGWNVSVLKKLVRNKVLDTLPPDERYKLSTYEAIHQQIKDNSFEMSYVHIGEIPVVDIFCREKSSKWSRYRITADKYIKEEGDNDFLMVQEEKWDDLNNFINFDLYEAGDNTIRSVKGLGHRIFTMFDANNRLVSNILGSAMLSNSLLLRPTNAGARTALNVVKRGPVMIIPEQFEVLPHNTMPQLEPAMGVRRMIMNILSNNAGIYSNISFDSGSRYRNKEEIGIEAMKNAQFERADSAFSYIFRDFFHTELFRRIMQDVNDIPDLECYRNLREELKGFRERCVKRGVPKEFLKAELYYVSATRAIGFGSPISKDYTTKELLNMLPLLDELGRRNVAIDRVASLVGYSMAGRYVSGQVRDKIPINETSIALLENNDIRQGLPVIVGVDQLHTVHIDIHIAVLTDIQNVVVNNLQNLTDVSGMMKALEICMQHIGQHIESIGVGAEQKKYEEIMRTNLTPLFNSLMQTLTLWQNKIAKQQEQISQVMSEKAQLELQAKLEEVAQRAYVKMRDKEMQNQIRAAKAQAEIELERQKLEAEIALKEREIDAKIARENKEQR